MPLLALHLMGLHVAVDIVTGTVRAKEFFEFLRGSLIPSMMMYNGTNPHSILIMDNCSIHHTIERPVTECWYRSVIPSTI